jgi:hypothetical protein
MPRAFAFRHSSATASSASSSPATNDEDSDGEDDDGDDAGLADSSATDEVLPGVSESVLAEDYPLYLPSGLSDELLNSTSADLIQKELRGRLTVLEITFDELRRLLRVKLAVVNNKKSFVVGQKGNTRAQTLLAGFTDKIEYTANRYREVRAALGRLDPDGTWTTRLRPLLKNDVRMPQEDEDPDDKHQQRLAKKRKQLGEGSRKPSWIWRVSSVAQEDGKEDVSLGDGEYRFQYDT